MMKGRGCWIISVSTALRLINIDPINHVNFLLMCFSAGLAVMLPVMIVANGRQHLLQWECARPTH